jgi:hypothetical protein
LLRGLRRKVAALCLFWKVPGFQVKENGAEDVEIREVTSDGD